MSSEQHSNLRLCGGVLGRGVEIVDYASLPYFLHWGVDCLQMIINTLPGEFESTFQHFLNFVHLQMMCVTCFVPGVFYDRLSWVMIRNWRRNISVYYLLERPKRFSFASEILRV